MRFEPLLEGVLQRRGKRFLSEVELASGELVTAHCANTGPMTGVLHPGGRVRVRHDPSPKRKLAYTWEQANSEMSGYEPGGGRARQGKPYKPRVATA